MTQPYMVQLCRKLFHIDKGEENTLASVCSNWLYQALDHCTALLATKPGCQKLWNKLLKLKHLIFPESVRSLLSDQLPISVQPDLLGPEECQELTKQIVRDYIHYIPLSMHENRCLWQLLRGVLGVLVTGVCLVIVVRGYNAICVPVKKQPKESPTLLQYLLKRNIRRVLYETKYLSIVPVMDPSLLHCGCPVLGLRIDAKQLCNIKAMLVKSVASDNPADADGAQAQSIAKLQKFFHSTGKCRVVISLDWGREDDCEGCHKANARNSAIPIHKPPKRVGIQRKL